MNTVKESKPIVTTVTTWDLHVAGKLFDKRNTLAEIEFLSKLLINPKNLTYRHCIELGSQNKESRQFKISDEKQILSRKYIDLLSSQYLYKFNRVYNNSKQTSLSSKNLKLLNKIFNEQIKDYHPLDFTEETVKNCFNNIANKVAELKFNYCNIFINNTNKIKFTLYFDEGKILMINKSFELVNELNLDNIITYSFFVDKELIVSDVVEIRTLIDGFKRYI